MTALMLFLAAPELLYSVNPHRHTPLWVPLSSAVTPEGRLSPEYFDHYALRDLQTAAADNRRSICLGESPTEIATSSDSIAAVAANAKAMIEGKIVQRTVGFFYDRPAALLTVRIGRQAGNSVFPTGGEMLLYYPETTSASARRLTACGRRRSPPGRESATMFLVFVYEEPADTTDRLIYTQAGKHLVFETAAGQLIPPVALRDELQKSGITTLDQLFERIGDQISRQRTGFTSSRRRCDEVDATAAHFLREDGGLRRRGFMVVGCSTERAVRAFERRLSLLHAQNRGDCSARLDARAAGSRFQRG